MSFLKNILRKQSDIDRINQIEKKYRIKLKKIIDKGEQIDYGAITYDDNLYSSVYDGKSFCLDDDSVISLDFSSCRMGNISILKRFYCLTDLNLRINQIGDISSLKKLKSLTRLNLHLNHIIDISPLKELKNLTHLGLYANHVSDISPLKELKNLTHLGLSSNQISDISPLKELKNLTHLNLGFNQISDISPLKELKNLTHLNLENNKISDISPLKELKSLTELRLGYNYKISGNISSLNELKALTYLNLNNTGISDISSLKELKGLISLILENNKISDISPLKDLKSLWSLNLHFNKISDFSALKELKDLTILNFDLPEMNQIMLLKELKVKHNSGLDLVNRFYYDKGKALFEAANANDDSGIREIIESANELNRIRLIVLTKELLNVGFAAAGRVLISMLEGLKDWTYTPADKTVITDDQYLSDITKVINESDADFTLLGCSARSYFIENVDNLQKLNPKLTIKTFLPANRINAEVEMLNWKNENLGNILVGPHLGPPWLPFDAPESKLDIKNLLDNKRKISIIWFGGDASSDLLLSLKKWAHAGDSTFTHIINAYDIDIFTPSKEQLRSIVGSDDKQKIKEVMSQQNREQFEAKYRYFTELNYFGDPEKLIEKAKNLVDIAFGISK